MHIFSEHFKTDHILSKIDARIKLLVALALLTMVLTYKGIVFPVIIAAGCLVLCMRMGVPLRILLLRMAQPLFLALVILFLKLFFSGNNEMFLLSLPTSNFKLFTLTGHSDGLAEGLRIVSRILGGVSLLVLLGFSTPFSEFMAGLSWLRVPRQFIEIMMFAYRYLFVFLEDGLTIYNAQKNRLGYCGIRRGLRSFGTLTGSLVLRSFEQSQKTSEAMIQRGYTGDMPLMKDRPLNTADIVIGLILIVFMGSIWMMK